MRFGGEGRGDDWWGVAIGLGWVGGGEDEEDEDGDGEDGEQGGR